MSSPLATRIAASELDSAFGSYLAGRVARHRRDTGAAARYFSRALADDPENLNLLRQTYLSLHAEGRMDDATRLAQRIVELRPKEPIAGLTLAVEHIRNGEFAEARKQLGLAATQGYNTLLVPLLSAWAAAAQGDFDQAIKVLSTLNKSEAFAVFRELHAALINDLAGNVEAAEKAYRFAVAAQPGGSFRVVAAFGAFYERLGKFDEARALYAAYKKENPDSTWFDRAMARIAAHGKPERTVSNAREGAAEVLFGVASALHQENALEAALIYARLAIRLRPGFDAAYMLLGEILETQNRWAVAISAYDAIPPKSPLYWSAQIRISANLDSLNRTNDAVEKLKNMARQRPERADALITLGDLLRARERWSEAVAAYDQALERVKQRKRRHWRPLYARGISLERAKQWPRAERDFLAALDLEPDQPFVLNYLGYSWVDKGINLDRALKMIERAVELRPHDGYIIDSLGWAQYRLGNYPASVAQLERAVELKPDDPTINDHLGDAYWRVGRHIEARFQWRRALALGPQEADMTEKIEKKLRKGLPVATVADGTG
ncbi:MAG: tetratricopeptide repeat protein [Alphaproteobacteria bacterium]